MNTKHTCIGKLVFGTRYHYTFKIISWRPVTVLVNHFKEKIIFVYWLIVIIVRAQLSASIICEKL